MNNSMNEKRSGIMDIVTISSPTLLVCMRKWGR